MCHVSVSISIRITILSQDLFRCFFAMTQFQLCAANGLAVWSVTHLLNRLWKHTKLNINMEASPTSLGLVMVVELGVHPGPSTQQCDTMIYIHEAKVLR